MNPKQVTDAYSAVLRLSNSVFPYKTARSIARLKKVLADEVDTIYEAEVAIVERFGGKVNKRTKFAEIEDPEQKEKCDAALEEFREQVDEIKLPVVDLSRYANTLRISPADIDALEGIVIFEGEGKERDG